MYMQESRKKCFHAPLRYYFHSLRLSRQHRGRRVCLAYHRQAFTAVFAGYILLENSIKGVILAVCVCVCATLYYNLVNLIIRCPLGLLGIQVPAVSRS